MGQGAPRGTDRGSFDPRQVLVQPGALKPETDKATGEFRSVVQYDRRDCRDAGVDGFLANVDTMFDQADSEAMQWEAFLLELADLFGCGAVSSYGCS